MSKRKQDQSTQGNQGIIISGGTVHFGNTVVGQEARLVTIGAVQSKEDLASELAKLKAELDRAVQAGVFEEETGTDAQYQLTKAVQQAEKPEPDKKTLLDHLNSTTELIKGVAAAGGLVDALVTIAQKVHVLLPPV